MKHYVLTRAVYDPELWLPRANERRLALFEGITARSLHVQDATFEWIVQVHRDDPFRAERERIATRVGGRTVEFTPGTVDAKWERTLARRGEGQRRRREATAVVAYSGFRSVIPNGGGILTTRIDDDDAFHPGALRAVQREARPSKSGIIVLPRGIRVAGGRYDEVWHASNAWQTYVARPGDEQLVYDYPHRHARQVARVRFAAPRQLMWLWVRHAEALSGHHMAEWPIDAGIMQRFPIDWSLLPEPARTKGKRGRVRFA